jgi:hypothetical protein
MSYDVSVGSEDFNYTSNVSGLFYDHIPDMGKGGGLRELDGVTGARACRIIGEAFKRISETRHRMWSEDAVGEPAFCAKYDAPNGWGSAIGALTFLAEILAACADNRRSKVRVYA